MLNFHVIYQFFLISDTFKNKNLCYNYFRALWNKVMEILLTPYNEKMLRDKVAEGLYNSLNEAINVTLEIALKGGCISQDQLDKLNSDIQEGIDDANNGNLSDAFEFLDDMSA